ncbi:MAG: PspC domain-containing protein [Propionibacteriaceae bacterium]|jgi:phage shock protein PspC (stress-responsive transcriptional regulator)|nr:PspC domain-containing protein [Propionibacteriaceae bacterium]
MSTNGPLARSRDNRIIGGVCGGIAKFIGLDPGLVRLITVLLMVLAGTGLLIYIVLWIVLPEEGSGTTGLDNIIGSFRDGKGGDDLR